jgi:hypothetical protein
MELKTIVIILIVLLVLNLIYTYYVHCRQEIINIEGFEVSQEALQDLASMLKEGEMKVTNLEVTGNLKATNAQVSDTLLSDYATFSKQLSVTGRTNTRDLHLDGIKIAKHPSKPYLQIPYPVEINNAMSSEGQNKPVPGLMVGNVISTTSLADDKKANDYAIGVMAEANKLGLPNGSWVSGIGKHYYWSNDRGDPYNAWDLWYAKKMQTPKGLSRGGYDFLTFLSPNILKIYDNIWYNERGQKR